MSDIDDKRRPGWMDDEERALFGHKPGSAPKARGAAGVIVDKDLEREAGDEITDVEIVLHDIRKELAQQQHTYGHTTADSALRAIVSRIHRHVTARDRRLTNKLTYVSQGGVLASDGSIPEPGKHPCTELADRLDVIERSHHDLVGIPGGKAGGRVDHLEHQLAGARRIVIAALIAAAGSIGGAFAIAVKWGDDRGTVRTKFERLERDVKDHVADHHRFGAWPGIPAGVKINDPGDKP